MEQEGLVGLAGAWAWVQVAAEELEQVVVGMSL